MIDWWQNLLHVGIIVIDDKIGDRLIIYYFVCWNYYNRHTNINWLMINDKMNENIYCMWMIWLMIRWMIIFIVCRKYYDWWWDEWEYLLYVEIIMIDDKMNKNIYCVWKLLWLIIRWMRIFIVCG